MNTWTTCVMTARPRSAVRSSVAALRRPAFRIGVCYHYCGTAGDCFLKKDAMPACAFGGGAATFLSAVRAACAGLSFLVAAAPTTLVGSGRAISAGGTVASSCWKISTSQLWSAEQCGPL
jgi:hypothetical protein